MPDPITDPSLLPPWTLPVGVTSRFVDTSPVSLKYHILESIPADTQREGLRLILLLHGFPNLSYDWRHVLPKLAKKGYYAVAVDLRGFGRTHNADLSPLAESTFCPLMLARDVVTLVHALGYSSIHTLVGHDLGAYAAAVCSLARRDMIKSLVLMSHPFGGPPTIPFGTSPPETVPPIPTNTNTNHPVRAVSYKDGGDPDIHSSLLNLSPPRKHYKWYNASASAASEWTYPTGPPLHEFLRGYFHLKSADWVSNNPQPLKSWTADELSVLPHYYVMRADLSMRGNVARDMAQEGPEVLEKLASTPWLTDADLAVYAEEFSRNTFADALRWYAVLTDPDASAELSVFAGAKISVPTKYVSGTKDWGNYQVPGALEAMEQGKSVEGGLDGDTYKGTVMVEGAGHWVQMERPDETAAEILDVADIV